jgi:3-phytase/alkaline phosphatase D
LAVRRLCSVLLISVAVSSCLGAGASIKRPEIARDVTSLTLVGQFSFPVNIRYPPILGLPFGGISGLTSHNEGHELYGISDAQTGGRIYKFELTPPESDPGSMRVQLTRTFALAMSPGDDRPDHEGLTLLPDLNFAVSAEGTTRVPRLPPSVNIYGRHGEFIRRLVIPEKFIPEPTGEQTRGARGNAGFESLTLTPNGTRLFTAAETALIQDGDPATFDAGARTRILEFVARRQTYEPAREFAYDLEPIVATDFKPKSEFNGLVDMAALSDTTLLTLERAFVEDGGTESRSIATIRIFKIDISGATNIASLDSTKGHAEIVPVKKTLVLDLAKVRNLSPDLAPHLDNFEGMTFGPRLPDGRASLLIVSDDNFRATQRTWFLMFAIQ